MFVVAQIVNPIVIPSPSPTPGAAISERSLLSSRLDEIVNNAKARTGGTLGAVIWDLGTNVQVQRNAQQPFPMTTMTKLAIAYATCRAVDNGYLQWNEAIYSAPVQVLLERMLDEDDDNSGDALYRTVGGGDGIDSALHDIGVDGMIVRIDLGGLRAEANAGRTFATGGDNAASPLAVAQLFSEISSGKALDAPSLKVCSEYLATAFDASSRLHAGLPAGTRLEHVAGTSGSLNDVVDATNDAGIAYINGRRVIIVAMLQGASGTEAERDAIIADVARAAYDATRLFPV